MKKRNDLHRGASVGMFYLYTIITVTLLYAVAMFLTN